MVDTRDLKSLGHNGCVGSSPTGGTKINNILMSRSYKKPYACYVCYFSNKKDKRRANRKFRRFNKIFSKINPEKLKYKLKEVSNVWSFSSDGLACYVGNSELSKSDKFDDKETFRKWIQK